MNRDNLEIEVRDILSRAEFIQSPPYIKSVVFDIIARRENTTLILKLLLNIDTFKEETAIKMKVLSSMLLASPLLVGLKSGSYHLEKSVVYMRHGIPAMNPETLKEFLVESTPPFIFAAPGGYFVKIDGKKLRELREKRGLSLGMVARVAGVSRRTILMYEHGDISANLDAALRLEEFFEENLIKPLNPLDFEENATYHEPENSVEKEIADNLCRIGYEIYFVSRCPFEAVTSDRKSDVYITGIEKEGESLKKKAKIVREISDVTYRESFIIVKRSIVRGSIEKIPIITLDELKKMREKEDLKRMLEERV